MTWREELLGAMGDYEETFDDIVSLTLSEEELDREFSGGYGTSEGLPFTCWTKHRVYFPVEYDGSERVASVARNPDGKPTNHL